MGASDAIGIIGGTGALGRGLAGRWAAAGLEVHLGSRDAERAQGAAGRLRERLAAAPGAGAITGATNQATAAAARTLVLAVPWEGVADVLVELEGALDGRILISAVNPLGFDEQGPHLSPVDTGSAAESIAARAHGATVVAAFHAVSSQALARWDEPLDDDVPIAGDDEAACAQVAALADRIVGCRGVVVGPLRLAVAFEALTPAILALNRRTGAHVGLRFSRLPR